MSDERVLRAVVWLVVFEFGCGVRNCLRVTVSFFSFFLRFCLDFG